MILDSLVPEDSAPSLNSPTPPPSPESHAGGRIRRNPSYVTLPTRVLPAIPTDPVLTVPAAAAQEPSVDELVKVMGYLGMRGVTTHIPLPSRTMSEQLLCGLHRAGALALVPPRHDALPNGALSARTAPSAAAAAASARTVPAADRTASATVA
ncbi:hypothetical protein EIP86_006726, partial [Pleurotus ostreatoroseus]